MSATPHPLATPHLPGFITPPGATDTMLTNVALVLVGAVLVTGVLLLKLHSLPERKAHKGQKLQFEIVAVLCLLSLFTHNHAFWVAGLLLAYIDIPDFGSPLRRIARSTESLAGIEPLPEDLPRALAHDEHHDGEEKPLPPPAPATEKIEAAADVPALASAPAPAAVKGA
jgi:hypothetical protein